MQTKAQLKMNFRHIKIAIKSKLARILETLNQDRIRCVDFEAEADNSSTESLQMRKNQHLDLQQPFERYCITLPVFAFNCARYDVNLMKSYLILSLVFERDSEETTTKKTNQFVSFKFGNVPLLDLLNFLGVATILDLFLKTYKTSDTIGTFSTRMVQPHREIGQQRTSSLRSLSQRTSNLQPS